MNSFWLFANLFGGIFSVWWLWLLVTTTLLYLSSRNNRKINLLRGVSRSLLLIEVPRGNDKKENATEHLFANLHGILSDSVNTVDNKRPEHLSFEISATAKQIKFNVSTPKYLQKAIESQIYAQYPEARIQKSEIDYAIYDIKKPVSYGVELGLAGPDDKPINVYSNFEVDPLSSLLESVSRLADNEEIWVQIMIRPYSNVNSSLSTGLVESLRNLPSSIYRLLIVGLRSLISPPENPNIRLPVSGSPLVPETKFLKPLFQSKIRIVYRGESKESAKFIVQNVIGTFRQFDNPGTNWFIKLGSRWGKEIVEDYKARLFVSSGSLLNTEELAGLYHLPNSSVETPNILWVQNKTAHHPSNLPLQQKSWDPEISCFGVTNFRNSHKQFGIKRSDRNKHIYIIGQTGVGKSSLLEILMINDIYDNFGFGILDPHGDLSDAVVSQIPPNRASDLVYFNPADKANLPSFNPLEVVNPDQKNLICSELVSVFKKMFDSWGPRLEYILRHSLMSLLDNPGSTLADIPRLLTDDKYRKNIVMNVQNTETTRFWKHEFDRWDNRYRTEAIAPVINKVGAFVTNPIISEILNKPKSTLNFSDIINSKKIFVANLSKGLIGEDNSSILGSLIITKIQIELLNRASKQETARYPYYLYIDEFQNFVSESFNTLLSEGRKYGLCITMANQYVSQLSQTIKDSVIGNAGTIISFRVGVDDAKYLQAVYLPSFSYQDLTMLERRHMLISMLVDGNKTNAFTAITLNVPPALHDGETIKSRSQKRYSYRPTIGYGHSVQKANTLTKIDNSPKMASKLTDIDPWRKTREITKKLPDTGLERLEPGKLVELH